MWQVQGNIIFNPGNTQDQYPFYLTNGIVHYVCNGEKELWRIELHFVIKGDTSTVEGKRKPTP